MGITYKKAGVDISEIKKSQNVIGRLIASTHNLQKKTKTTHGFGHYAGIVEIPGGKLLATHTDGVGTKVIIAIRRRGTGTPIKSRAKTSLGFGHCSTVEALPFI